MAQGTVNFEEETCKGCGLCIPVCPKDLIVLAERLNARGYHPAELVDPDLECTGCALCAVICPDVAITVYRSVPVRARRARVM